jgi:hypothetical protein
MKNQGFHILEKLAKETCYLRRRIYLLLSLNVIILLLLPFFALSILDYFVPLREHTAFICGIIFLIASIAIVSRYLFLKSKEIPDNTNVALMIEKSCPELMDSLICSVELLGKPDRDLNHISGMLIQDVDHKLRQTETHAIVLRQAVISSRLLMLVLLAVFVFAVIGSMHATDKILAHSRDLLKGGATGLIVSPGNTEVAVGGDVSISALVMRGPDESSITIENGDGKFAYDMYGSEGGSFSFEIFSIDSDFTYTISTPTLQSREYTVATYRKPEIVACKFAVSPAAYTTLPHRQIDELSDFSVPRGSSVTIFLTTNMPVTAGLVTDADQFNLLKAMQEQTYQTVISIEDDFTYKIILEDRLGHKTETDKAYTIESIDDFSPIIHILAPTKDVSERKNAEVSLSFKANDDYGLDRLVLHYFISGKEQKSVTLFTHKQDTAAAKEELVAHRLVLQGIVENGDVISYYCTATDNSIPEANVGTSEVQFIEIRPEKPDIENNQEGGSGNTKSLSVSDFIVEQKHLIRTVLDIQKKRSAEQKTEAIHDLSKASADLYLAAQERFAELRGEPSGLPQPDTGDIAQRLLNEMIIKASSNNGRTLDLGVIGKLFEDAIDNMGRARDFHYKKLVNESLSFQQLSLSKLISIEIELDKNPPPTGEGGEGEESASEKEVKEKNQQKNQQQRSAMLDQLSAVLDKLIQQQGNLNEDLATGQNKKSPIFNDHIKADQQDIIDESKAMRVGLNKLKEARLAGKELREAIRHMEQLLDRTEHNQLVNAERHGQLAKQFLQRTQRIIEKLHLDMISSKLKEASAALQSIAGQQSDLMSETRKQQDAGEGSDGSQSRKLRNSQKQIRENLERLTQHLSMLAGEFGELDSNVGGELEDALDQTYKDNISGKMKRSENAIRYRKYEKALDSQQQANTALARLSHTLQDIMQKNLNLTMDELSRMLQKILKDIAKIQQAMEDQANKNEQRDLFKKISKDLKEMPGNIPSMDSAAKSIGELAFGKSEIADDAGEKILAMLYQSASLLEARLMQETMKERINLGQVHNEQPPDEYKKLVQQYFKNLSETKIQ